MGRIPETHSPSLSVAAHSIIHDLVQGSAIMLTTMSELVMRMEAQGVAPEWIQDAWQHLRSARTDYDRLVANMRDAVQLVDGPLSLLPRPIPLDLIVDDVLHTMRVHEPRRRTSRLEYHRETDDTLVWADHDRVGRVVYHLVERAVAASQEAPGGGRVQLTVSATATAGVLTIIHNGRGMTPEAIHELETRMHQAPTLAIDFVFCQRIIQASGGSAMLTSSGSQQGTTVTIQLPRPPHHTKKET